MTVSYDGPRDSMHITSGTSNNGFGAESDEPLYVAMFGSLPEDIPVATEADSADEQVSPPGPPTPQVVQPVVNWAENNLNTIVWAAFISAAVVWLLAQFGVNRYVDSLMAAARSG